MLAGDGQRRWREAVEHCKGADLQSPHIIRIHLLYISHILLECKSIERALVSFPAISPSPGIVASTL